jgi:hypothetical protein
MADDVARDRRLFAPTPQRIAFLIDGERVETDLYNWMDLPVKESIAVYTAEEEMRTDTAGGYPALMGHLRRLVALLCPRLDADWIERLTPRQLHEAVGASHGVAVPSPEAEGSAASPSPSAVSTTRSP